MDELREIRDKIAGEEAKEEIKERTPLKGEDFEDFCERFLGEYVCKSLGTELNRTSEEIGELSNCKKGDFVVEPPELEGGKIVLEMKSGTISQRKILEEKLPEAMDNRMADYGILVSKYVENLPNKIGWFNEYRENMLVGAMGSKEKDELFPNMLNIVLQFARQRLLQKKTEEAEINVEEVKKGIDSIEQKLGEFKRLKRKTTSIEKASKKIDKIADGMREDIKVNLSKMSEAMK